MIVANTYLLSYQPVEVDYVIQSIVVIIIIIIIRSIIIIN